MLPYVLWTLGAVAAVLASDLAGWRTGAWIAKPLASTGFVAAAVAAGAFQSRYGQLVLLGLLLSWLGDVLLIPRNSPPVFRAGVISFLLGHVAFASAFVTRGIDARWALAAACVAAVIAVGAVRWLGPRLPGYVRAAAYAYVVVISVMVVTALGAFGATGNAAIAAGAVAFYASDLSVARDRFLTHAFVNRLWGLPLYYAAQLILAYSIKV